MAPFGESAMDATEPMELLGFGHELDEGVDLYALLRYVGIAICALATYILPTVGEVLTRESPEAAAAHDDTGSPLELSAEHVRQLQEQSFVVVDQALTNEQLAAARSDIAAMVSTKRFAATAQHGDDLRSDSIFWMTEDAGAGPYNRMASSSTPELKGMLAVIRRLRGLAVQLKRHGAGVRDTAAGSGSHARPRVRAVDLGVPREAQIARYVAAPPQQGGAAASKTEAVLQRRGGSRYSAHRDYRPPTLADSLFDPTVSMREYTAIAYVNLPKGAGSAGGASASGAAAADDGGEPSELAARGVADGDGETLRRVEDLSTLRPGALVLYLGAKPHDKSGSSAKEVVELLPEPGRLVIFDSRTVLHEVRPHTSQDVERVAVTVWIGGAHTFAGMLRHEARKWALW